MPGAHSLKTVEGLSTRPTTDRIKETLFNMIAPYLYDCVFLDLFAGSGAIGIEALSRGAMEAVFVEQDRKAMSCVKRKSKKDPSGGAGADHDHGCDDSAL